MKSRLTKESWVLTKPITHRGLWEEGIPENSMSAYENSIKLGYPIEMDVQMSVDGELFCFHDDNLKRMTGVDEDIRTLTAEEIKQLKIGDEHIPTFRQFLDFINGQVPILVEIKQQINKGVEQKVVDHLKDYKGEFAVQSFDPFIMMKIKKLAPHFVRGQLGVNSDKKGLKWHVARNLSFNFIVRPDFVHYCVNNLPITKKVTNGLPLMVWTVDSQEDLNIAKQYAQNFVFEKIRV